VTNFVLDNMMLFVVPSTCTRWKNVQARSGAGGLVFGLQPSMKPVVCLTGSFIASQQAKTPREESANSYKKGLESNRGLKNIDLRSYFGGGVVVPPEPFLLFLPPL
jgi:hypothetical protein